MIQSEKQNENNSNNENDENDENNENNSITVSRFNKFSILTSMFSSSLNLPIVTKGIDSFLRYHVNRTNNIWYCIMVCL